MPPSPTAAGYAALASDRTPERELGSPHEFDVPARRWPIVALFAFLGVLVFGAGAFAIYQFAIRPMMAPPAPPSTIVSPSPGSATTSTAETSSGAGQDPTASAEATKSPAGTKTPGSGSSKHVAAMPTHAPLVAYRAEGGLWVANDDGGDRRRVVGSDAGEFALSPDGSRLAVADTATQHLLIADVATGRTVDVGAADDDPPAWAPDGSFVVWTATRGSAPRVMRAGRDGGSPLALGIGSSPQVSLDGSHVLFIETTGQAESGPLVRADASVPGRGRVTLANDTVFAFAQAPEALAIVTGVGKSSLVRTRSDGTGATQLLGPPAEAGAYTYARLSVSPDGRSLVFARAGDDGFSRMSVMPLAGGTAVDLSPRHDDYPLGWAPDSTRILFVSGNATAGQKTDLASIRPDGSNRIVLVTGAGL